MILHDNPLFRSHSLTLNQAGGALLLVVGLLGWYMTFVMMSAEMRLAINLPVGDLSHFWPRTDVEMGTAAKQS